MTIRKSSAKRYTPFRTFFKKFYPYTADYHFFLLFCISPNATFLKNLSSTLVTIAFFFAFCFCVLEKVEKSSRAGIKSRQQILLLQQSSRTGIFYSGGTVRNMHILLQLNWI